jgi:murein L,D-transpeptidase YafK
LTDFYGPGAFPLSYPNEWDKREGRDGHGIWLHGTPSDTYSRPPRASNGCVVLSNEDLLELSKYVRIGVTPVVIGAKPEWLEPEEWQARKGEILAAIERWRQDWESLDADRYLSNYGNAFSAEGRNLAAWGAQKRAVNLSKTTVKVTLNNLNIYDYPGAENMVVVDFDQDYKSNNLSNQKKKRQYWLRESDTWRIVYEGSVEAPEPVLVKRILPKRASVKRGRSKRS